MFSARDKEVLEIFAYNRLLVRRFDEALPVYELLWQLEGSKNKWQLAQVWCLYHLGREKKAQQQLAHLSPATLTSTEKPLFSRLSHLVSPPAQPLYRRPTHEQ